MQTGLFRRQVMKTMSVKASKLALRTVAKNTQRVQIAQGTVALKVHSGRLMQAMSQYVLGLQMTQEMKQDADVALGDIGYDLALLSRVLKAKLPSATKKSKLVGTRAAALLHLDVLSTNLLDAVQKGLFVSPKMTTVKKMVTVSMKDGAHLQEEREVSVVDTEGEKAAETARQHEMQVLLSAVVDVFWRLCLDITGKPPVGVMEEKFTRMQAEFPSVTWVVDAPKTAPKAPTEAKAKAPKAKAKAEKTEQPATA